MTIDTSALSNLTDIASGVLGGTATIIGFYWKYVLIPNKEFKRKVLENIEKNKEYSAENLKLIQDNQKRISDINTILSDHKKILESEIEEVKEILDKEIEDIKEDHKDLTSSFNNQIHRMEDRNEKLLDLIVKYFSGN